jgi:hypothetical protein
MGLATFAALWAIVQMESLSMKQQSLFGACIGGCETSYQSPQITYKSNFAFADQQFLSLIQEVGPALPFSEGNWCDQVKEKVASKSFFSGYVDVGTSKSPHARFKGSCVFQSSSHRVVIVAPNATPMSLEGGLYSCIRNKSIEPCNFEL